MEPQQQGKFQLIGVVRDKNGTPKFDDIHNIHPQQWAMLTPKEKADIDRLREK